MLHLAFMPWYREVAGEYFDTWGRDLRDRVTQHVYSRLPVGGPLPPGVWILGDLERMVGAQHHHACRLADRLSADPSRYTLLNHPRRVLGRYPLLRKLHAQGVNDFNVYRLDELDDDVRYPVFVRFDTDHGRTTSGLLPDRPALDAATRELMNTPKLRLLRKRVIVTELCNVVSDDGLFRKYSAMRIGEHLIPRHMLVGDGWLTKKPKIVTPDTVAEENEYIETFPHEAEIRRVFDLANIEYGRIDYSVKEGRVQVWEINTNPVIVPMPEQVDELRMDSQAASAERINRVFRELADRPHVENAPIHRPPLVSRLITDATRVLGYREQVWRA